MNDPGFTQWTAALEARYLADLTFQEVARALRALSSAYVERRSRIGRGEALSGAGKRAAFALFYGPLHYLMVRHIAAAVGSAAAAPSAIVDLGCGTGAAGAGFAAGGGGARSILGIDRNAWALDEAARTYRTFGLKSRTIRGDFATTRWDGPARGPADRLRQGYGGPPKLRAEAEAGRHRSTDRKSLVAAFSINELDAIARDRVRERLLDCVNRGDRVLIVEPLAGFVAPWWSAWWRAFEAAGGRADEWRASIELPAIVQKLDRAAGLDHKELTARSILAPAFNS